MAEILKDPLLLLTPMSSYSALLSLNHTIFSQTDVTVEAPEQPLDAENSKLIDSMRSNMRVVSFICNFWTIILSTLVILKLAQQIWSAKKNREKKRSKLYFTSILFVSIILV